MKTETQEEVQNINHLFQESCKRFPDKIALKEKNNTLTFKELHQKVNERSTLFLTKDIQLGDRVLVLTPVSIDLYINLLALFEIGAIAVFLDQWSDKKRLLQACKTVSCKAMIASKKIRFLSLFFKEGRKIKLRFSPNGGLKNKSINFPEVSKIDIALLTFTTGSTGIPKAPIRTHEDLLAQFNGLLPFIEAEKERIDMPMLPIVLLLNLAIGRTSILPDYNPSKPKEFSPERIFQQCFDENVKSISGSPFLMEQLSIYSEKEQLSFRFDKVLSGGGPIFPEVAARMFNFLSNESEIVFGSTEAEPISSVRAETLKETDFSEQKGLLVGTIRPETSVKIIAISETPINGNELDNVTLKANEYGEIIVAGKQVLKRYFNNENAILENKIVVENICWHRTGDAGFLDENGNLFLLGRCKQIIDFHGKRYFPFLEENRLQQIEGVKMGTLLLKKNKLIVFLEIEKEGSEAKINDAVKMLFMDSKIVFGEIPRDKRHFTKIDYDKLNYEL